MPIRPGSEVAQTRSRLANAVRTNSPDLVTIRREFDVAKLAAHVEEVVSAAPPLTPAQRDRLATLLRDSRG